MNNITTSPYLTFNGNCKEAMGFYNSILEELLTINYFKDTPMKVSDEYKNKVVHAQICLKNQPTQTILMASDAMPDKKVIEGNNNTISLNIVEQEKAKLLFEKLSEGGNVIMDWQKTFWEAMYGYFIDRFGMTWQINCQLNENVSEEDDTDSETKIQDVNQLQQEMNNYKDNLLRERAEFINYKKRVSQEKIEIEGRMTSYILESLLPAFDSIDQLMSTKQSLNLEKKNEEVDMSKIQNLVSGVELIKKQILEAFQKYGLEEFNPIDEPFNPSLMEALNVQENKDVTQEIVGNVYQKGYKVKNNEQEKVLRPARVLVYKPIVKDSPKKNNDSNTDNKEENNQNDLVEEPTNESSV